MRLESLIFERVDNSPLILFRIVFGFLLFLESAGAILTGWVKQTFILPDFTFPMVGFEWLQPLPGDGMYGYYVLMAVAGLMMMVGMYFRTSLIVFTVLWTVTYLMQTTSYNNHYYLIIVLCILLLSTPAAAYCSWDAMRDPQRRSLTCPRWCIMAFVLQVTIVYLFAAAAKIYPDWLAGRPVEIWLSQKTDYPILGRFYQQEWMTWMIVYGGIAFDALIVPMLLWRRTRIFGFGVAVLFHLFNSYTFRIGIFPYLAIGLCAFFFPPDEIRKTFFKRKPAIGSVDPGTSSRPTHRRPVLAFLSLFFLVQAFLPLRHWLYPGNVHWTEEGHRMAWHMMVRTKAGSIIYLVKDPRTGNRWWVEPREYLSAKQARKIGARPDMIWQFSQRLKQEFAAKGFDQVEIYARSQVSLNGRKLQPLVHGAVDLANVDWHMFKASDWIVPLRN